jgi:uncharacterized phage protein (TIGR02216 family)
LRRRYEGRKNKPSCAAGRRAGLAPSQALASVAPFPWDEAIGFGLGVLRLDPDAFWRMTPRELAHAIRGGGGAPAPPLARTAFLDLMQRFPDG